MSDNTNPANAKIVNTRMTVVISQYRIGTSDLSAHFISILNVHLLVGTSMPPRRMWRYVTAAIMLVRAKVDPHTKSRSKMGLGIWKPISPTSRHAKATPEVHCHNRTTRLSPR